MLTDPVACGESVKSEISDKKSVGPASGEMNYYYSQQGCKVRY